MKHAGAYNPNLDIIKKEVANPGTEFQTNNVNTFKKGFHQRKVVIFPISYIECINKGTAD